MIEWSVARTFIAHDSFYIFELAVFVFAERFVSLRVPRFTDLEVFG